VFAGATASLVHLRNRSHAEDASVHKHRRAHAPCRERPQAAALPKGLFREPKPLQPGNRFRGMRNPPRPGAKAHENDSEDHNIYD